MPTYLNSVEAAEQLGIRRQTLSYHIKQGHIEPVTNMRGNGRTGTMFFRPSDVKKLGTKLARYHAKKASR